MLYQIQLPYATAGIEVEDGIVTVTAPIFAWMKGKYFWQVESWVRTKNGTLQSIAIDKRS